MMHTENKGKGEINEGNMINVPKSFGGNNHANNFSNMVGRHGAGRNRI